MVGLIAGADDRDEIGLIVELVVKLVVGLVVELVVGCWSGLIVGVERSSGPVAGEGCAFGSKIPCRTSSLVMLFIFQNVRYNDHNKQTQVFYNSSTEHTGHVVIPNEHLSTRG